MKTNRRRVSPQTKSGAWLAERQAILQRLCTWIEAKVYQGKKVRPLVQLAARRWNGKPFRCDPSRKLMLSANRLSALFYQWRRNGRISQALALNYCPANRRPVKSAEVSRFLRHAAAPDVFTFAAAFAAMQRPRPVSFSLNHLCQALPAGLRKELRRLFYARRQQRGIETRFRRFVMKGGWR